MTNRIGKRPLMLIMIATLVAGCAHTKPAAEQLVLEDHNLLTLEFDFEEENDTFYRAFMHTVHTYENTFYVNFDHGRILQRTTATMKQDEYGHPRVYRSQNAGECIIFSKTRIFSQDVFGDDGDQWVAVVGSSGHLRDGLIRGGKGCYVILTVNTSTVPDVWLVVNQFDSVRTRISGNHLIFEILFQNHSEDARFPQGKGRLVGMLE